MNAENLDTFVDDALAGFDYEPAPVPSTWTEENIYLTRRFADAEGFLSLDITPYTREPLDQLDNTLVREVTLCWASQVAKSITLTAGLGYTVCNMEGQAIFTLPTADAAKWHVNNRWKPIGEASPSIRAEGGFDRKNFKISEQTFDKLTVSWLGSNNASQGAMRSAPYLFLDEVDKMGESTDKEPGFFHLIKERCKSFPIHKIFKSSTPTLNNRGIWLEYKKSDQRTYLVPSPHAKQRDPFELTFEMVKWDKKAKDKDSGEWNEDHVRQSAYFRCPHTGRKIGGEHKGWMLRRGVWEPQNENASNRERGYHISSLYSPWLTPGDIAVKFLQDKKKPAGLHNFHNSWLGKPFVRSSQVNTFKEVDEAVKRSPRYAKKTIPSELSAPVFLAITIDVQQSHFWWVVRAWWADESSALIDYGMAFSYDDLEELITQQTYSHREGNRFPISVGMMDAGYEAKKTHGVYAFCARPNIEGVIFPTIGRTSKQGYSAPLTQRDVTFKEYTLDQTVFNDEVWKEELYRNRILGKSAPWYLPRNLDPTYRKQITDEKLTEVPKGDGVELVWEDTNNNHMGDCEKMQLILFARFAQVIL